MALSMIRKMVTRTSVLLLFFGIFIISGCTKTNNFTKQYTYGRDILEFTNSNGTHRGRGAKKIDTIITVTHVRSGSQQQDTMEYNNVTYSGDLTFISIKNIKLQEAKKRDFICSKEKITKNKYTIHTNTSIDIFGKILNDIIPLKSKKGDSGGIISNSSCIIGIISQSVSGGTKILPIGDNF